MSTFQTTVQHSVTLRFKNMKIEHGTDTSSLVNLGIASDIEFTESFNVKELKPDNAQIIRVGTINHNAVIKFALWEVNLTNIAALRGGMDALTPVAAAPISVTDELHTLTGVVGARLNYRNGAGTIVTSITVKDSVNGSCIQNTDYVLTQDSEGYTCIARVAGSTTITTGETCKVSYTYTPSASTKFTTGGLDTSNSKVLRLTNTDVNGKKFQITVFSVTAQKGLEFKFPSDEGADNWKPVIELKGIRDDTLTAGAQLYEIVDEQGVY